MKINSLTKYSNPQDRSCISKAINFGYLSTASGFYLQILRNEHHGLLNRRESAEGASFPGSQSGSTKRESQGEEARGARRRAATVFWSPELPWLPDPALPFAAFQRVTPARSRPGRLTGAGCAKRSHVLPLSRGHCSRRARKPAPPPPQRARRRHVYRRAPQIRGLRGVRESSG